MITVITFVPLLAALGAFLLPGRDGRFARLWALGGALVALALTLKLACEFVPNAELQFVERYTWIPTLGIHYFVGVDGLNLLLLVLTAIVAAVAVLASWKVKVSSRLYFALLSIEFTGLFGAFTALNFFHWFLFFEASLVPVFFLIKLFGNERRDQAAISFFLFTVLGSIPMLIGFLFLYAQTGTFDFIQLAETGGSGSLPGQLGPIYPMVFLAVLLGLWVKTPLVPLHIWQPEAYTQAPAPVSIILSALMSKLGVYGFLRIVLPIFPEALKTYATPLLVITVATILLGAFAALRQNDLKKVLAYSSLNHVGYCILGISVVALGSNGLLIDARSSALQGAILQMFGHGLTVAGLFYLLGWLEARTGSRFLEDFGGLRAVTPAFATLFTILTFSSIGLPFLAGFASEFLIFSGSFALAPASTTVSVLALLTTALFLLTVLQRVFTGPISDKWKELHDLSPRDWIAVAPLIILIFWVGITPSFWLRFSESFAPLLLQNYR